MAKNPFLAAFLSFLIPGLGQIYDGKIMMGVILVIVALILSTATTLLTIFAGILYIKNKNKKFAKFYRSIMSIYLVSFYLLLFTSSVLFLHFF
jgi:TM2 domain-containing membrane protein YozV